jgi:hypothetical protein
MGYNCADDFFYMQTAERRAGKVIWHKYHINRFELNVLCALSTFLQVHGRKIVGREQLFKWLGLDFHAKRKCEAYAYGLIRKGAVHRLSYRRPDGKCLGLTPFGVSLLESFWSEVEKIEGGERGRLDHPGFRTLAVDLQNLPQGYVLRQQGRMD